METLAVSTSHQRKGIGAALLNTVLKEVDRRGEKIYVHSSEMGRRVYEKLGWKVFGTQVMDLRKYGVEEVYVTWDLIREVGGV